MPVGIFQVVNGYLPRAMAPHPNTIKGFAMWGGVLAAGALFVVQPFEFLAENLGLSKPKEEK